MRTAIFLVLALCFGPHSFSQVIFMVPDGKHDSLEMFRQVGPGDPAFPEIKERYSRKPFLETAELFRLAQVYLQNEGKGGAPQPAYLALTGHQGGFPMRGFALKRADGTVINMRETDYIDLHKNTIKEDASRSGGYTLCHELGHIILGRLSGSYESKSSTIHYFSIVTDYNTAFNEGWGEHFENTAIAMEDDTAVRNAVLQDYSSLYERVSHFCTGFERDHRWPFRIQFYRATSLLWYTKLEDDKRIRYVKEHLAKYPPATLPLLDPWDAIRYRNTAVSYDPQRLRSPEQAASNEGVFADFMTSLVFSSAGSVRCDSGFYERFSIPPDSAVLLSPMMTQYLKIFHVMASRVRMGDPDHPPVALFIDGYCCEFPGEKEEVRRLWQQASGHLWTGQLAKEVWVDVPGAKHAPVAIIQCGVTIPVYSFNLNTGDRYDIAAYLDAQNRRQKAATLTGQDEERIGFDLTGIIVGAVSHIALRAFFWYLFFLPVALLISYGMKRPFGWKKAIGQTAMFLLLFLASLACLILSTNPLPWFGLFVAVITALKTFIHRRDRMALICSLLTFALMAGIYVYSLI